MFNILILLFSFTASADSSELLKSYCKELNGKVQKSYTCPKTKLKLNFGFCVFENEQGIEQFFDGCTGPDGGHTELFYPHCIRHDLCYHHEPVTNGLSRKDCDREFRDNLLDSCHRSKDVRKCQRWAKVMYGALRVFGNIAFNCAKYEASY